MSQAMLRVRRGLVILAVLAVALLLLAHVGLESEDRSTTVEVQAPQTGHTAPSSTAPASVATRFGWTGRVLLIAGDGHTGLREGAADVARFADPYGLAGDGAGTLYVADGGDNNRIRRIRADGQVDTLAGGHGEGLRDGQGADAAFHTPSGLAVDSAGNLYVADTGNHAIRKITPAGQVSTLAGTGVAGFRDGPAATAQFNGPLAVAVDAAGRVLVADTYNDRIRAITPDGQVSTLAGGDSPGWVDGPMGSSRLDTPCGLALDSGGKLWIADTRNHAIRTLDSAGQLVTVQRSDPEDDKALLRRPLALVVTADGYVYVAAARRGALLQISPQGQVHALFGAGARRLSRPTALLLDSEGHLLVSDAGGRRVHHVDAVPDPPDGSERSPDIGPAVDQALPDTRGRWPLGPQSARHEVVGTIGEVRGDGRGESRDHLHAGLDLRGEVGAAVLAIADAKVDSPLGSWGYGHSGEGIALGAISYIHVRVGRNGQGGIVDATRFQLLNDAAGKPERMRVRRGTRFRAGEVLGSINAMAHVHLSLGAPGFARDPMQLGFDGFSDRQPPRVEGITLLGADDQPLKQRVGGRLQVPRDAAGVRIVVDAWDQVDGSGARRRLGLLSLGYQLLRADGQPASGFETPRMTIDFSRLPSDETAVQTAYAADSGVSVHGSERTRFVYEVTNTVSEGRVAAGRWMPSMLAPGDYILRIVARDHAGNTATRSNELPLRLQ